MEKKKQLVFLEDSKGIVKTKDKIGNLFVLSDEEIKEGDWYYDHMYRLVFKATDTSTHKGGNNYKKIIATTDSSLYIQVSKWFRADDWGGKEFLTTNVNLPQILQSFIEYFISEYNKGNIITEVIVEYEEIKGRWVTPTGMFGQGYYGESSYKLKINSDNTINCLI